MRYIYLVLLLVVYSCANKKPKEGSINEKDKQVLQVDYKKADFVVNMDTLVKDIEIIELELTEDMPIGNIDKILIHTSDFFLWDNKNKCVWNYSLNGEYNACIRAAGKGPEEYLNISNISIDKNGNINILDNAKLKINKYDKLGSFLQTKELNSYCTDYLELADLEYFFYNGLKPDFNNQYHLQLRNRSNNDYCYFPAYGPWIYNYTNYRFITNGKNVYFHKEYDNKIFELNNTSLNVAYEIAFGKEAYSYEFMEKNKSIRELHKLEQNNKLVGNIQKACIGDNHLTFTYTVDKTQYNIFFNYTTGRMVNFRAKTNSKLKFTPGMPIYFNNGYYYTIMEPWMISPRVLENINRKYNTKLTQETGPTIIRYKLAI